MFHGLPDRFRSRPGDTATPEGRSSRASRTLAAVGTAGALVAVSAASHPLSEGSARTTAGETSTSTVSEESASTTDTTTDKSRVRMRRARSGGLAAALPVSSGHLSTERFSARPAATSARSARLNWPALARCESGGNPRAVSPSGRYRGLYQFSRATWRTVGGTGDPARAGSREQTTRAQMLYDRAGHRPWPVCGRRLYT
jgi:hypothetical protein